VQIVDEPAACGVTIHPLDKADQFNVSEMVGKKRAHDKSACREGSSEKMFAVSKRIGASLA